MSMIFQSYALWPHMTVAENIIYGLRLRKLDRDAIARKLAAILAITNLEALARALSRRTLRRPAAARGARPRLDRRAGNAAARRAAVQPRRQSARGNAVRDPPAARPLSLHHGLRHPRPGRGDDDRRPHRGHECRPDRSGSERPRTSTTGRSRSSSRASSAPATSSRAPRATPIISPLPAQRWKCVGHRLPAGDTAAVAIRQHDIALSAQAPQNLPKRDSPGAVFAPGLSRRARAIISSKPRTAANCASSRTAGKPSLPKAPRSGSRCRPTAAGRSHDNEDIVA